MQISPTKFSILSPYDLLVPSGWNQNTLYQGVSQGDPCISRVSTPGNVVAKQSLRLSPRSTESKLFGPVILISTSPPPGDSVTIDGHGTLRSHPRWPRWCSGRFSHWACQSLARWIDRIWICQKLSGWLDRGRKPSSPQICKNYGLVLEDEMVFGMGVHHSPRLAPE